MCTGLIYTYIYARTHMHTHVHTLLYTQVDAYVHIHFIFKGVSSCDHGTASRKSVGRASSLKIQAGVDAAVLRENILSISRHVKLENRLSASKIYQWDRAGQTFPIIRRFFTCLFKVI